MPTLTCDYCQKDFWKEPKEYKRRVNKGATHFFCSVQCLGYSRVAPLTLEERKCEKCASSFRVDARLPNRFCSRGCASAGSVTDYRKRRMVDGGHMKIGNLGTPADCLRIRESSKYAEVSAFLASQKIAHVFEFALGSYVFDLCLPSQKLLIEFDGPYHKASSIRAKDAQKDAYAQRSGFCVKRVLTPINEVPVPLVQEILRGTL